MKMPTRESGSRRRRLRPGTVVEVKSVDEIMATLDEAGAVDALPFMPEMLQFAGRRFTVSKRAEHSCDTIRSWKIMRRMRNAVYLDDLRCDGSSHAGCQAGCRLLWKEAWLKPADDQAPRQAHRPTVHPRPPELLLAGTMQPSDPSVDGSAVLYRCQATEMLRATEPIRSWDVRRYLRELWSGNVTPARFMTVLLRAGYRAVQSRLGVRGKVPLEGTCAGSTPRGELDLRPGEWVRVKSQQEIMSTLNADSKNRGLSFDWEMLPHCGATHLVQERVSRIVDDRSGKLIEINSDNLILEGVVCTGDHSSRRLFCPRAIYPYWREVWLERVPEPVAPKFPLDKGSSVEDE
jgi:hypothetical protein